MKVVDVMAPSQVKERTSVSQGKTHKPDQLKISEGTRASVAKWMEDPLLLGSECLWSGRFHERQYGLKPSSVTVFGAAAQLAGWGLWQAGTTGFVVSATGPASGRVAAIYAAPLHMSGVM